MKLDFISASAAFAMLLAKAHAAALPSSTFSESGEIDINQGEFSRRTKIPASLYSDQTSNGSIYRFGSNSVCNAIFYQYGSCGLSTYFTSTIPSSNSIGLVAMPNAIMDQFGASQNNALCGKIIEITGPNGVVKKAAIADTNVGGDNSIDMCLGLWKAFGHHDNDGSIFTGANSLKWKLVK